MGLPALQDDYLFLAPLIEARLAEQIVDLPVQVCETVEQVLAADKRQSVLMVMYAGDGFDDDAAAGRSQQLRQRWLVIVALNNVSAARDARQSGAGPLMSRVHRALTGWTPAGAAHPFKRVTAPLRPDIKPTKALYPLGFEIKLAL